MNFTRAIIEDWLHAIRLATRRVVSERVVRKHVRLLLSYLYHDTWIYLLTFPLKKSFYQYVRFEVLEKSRDQE